MELLRALQDRGKPINIEWYVKKLLGLLSEENARVGEKVQVLDRLKELLVLGAIQDPALSEYVTKRVEVGASASVQEQHDPFLGGRKLKIAK